MASLVGWIEKLYVAIAWLIGLAKPDNLRAFVEMCGPAWVPYAVLAAIIFSETGLLVGFFLPGDSMLFAAGLLASQQVFDVRLLIVVLAAAGILGDAVNFQLGAKLGAMALERGRLRFVKHEHLLAAHQFYEKHGAAAIVLARFVPLVRTFTPFVAGVSRMNYAQFVIYNVAGGIGWVASMTLAGYFLGSFEWISKNFELVVVGIVAVSLMPIVLAAVRRWRARRAGRLAIASAGNQPVHSDREISTS